MTHDQPIVSENTSSGRRTNALGFRSLNKVSRLASDRKCASHQRLFPTGCILCAWPTSIPFRNTGGPS